MKCQRLKKTKQIWTSMLYRCDEKKRRYGTKSYWGRGIKVCDRWMDFDNFLKDMGLAPEGYVIDRIDGNGNYELSNCRWVTPSENAKNKNRNVSKHIYDIKPTTSKRYMSSNEPVNIDVVSLRDRIYKIMMNCDGLTIEKIAEEMNITPFTLHRFLKNSASRYTTVMRLKILKWIESEEVNNGTM